MALAPIYPFLSPLSAPSPHSFKLFPATPSSLFLFLTRNPSPPPPPPPPPPPSSIAHHLRANSSKRDGASMESSASTCLDKELLRRVAGAKDADQAMDFIVEAQGRVGGGEVGNEDCRLIIVTAIDRGNVELALSVFHAMRSGFGQGLSEKITSVERWSWARPNVPTCALLVQRLAASLRVSDAIRIITYVSQVGVSSGEEVPFGMIVPCPICMIAVSVAQPQQGIQVASCSKCRYQYQLVSGDIVSIDSEVISMDNSAWQRALRFLQIREGSTPAALHSIVLPRRTVDVIALKQQLLSQYDMLQTRIKDLRQVAEKEVWMLARMCQLENKIVAVGEPSYRARRGRVKKVRESLENSLFARIELIESYAKISSMIEIEVEMESDVLAAEAVSNAESIAEQIQQMMEIENLEERWRIQAEANDEVEMLLNSQPESTELV